ncbi:hypothetical protein K502DRAFT_346830 [Neoconidiobolus thromboides FSU 785]|nr:hypothetical protein K502DRAFT_346830 [Neoconidiobolus thromboides FSU 785]
MNCVDIEITGGTPGGKLTGKEMLVADLPGYPIFEEFSIAGPQLENILYLKKTASHHFIVLS